MHRQPEGSRSSNTPHATLHALLLCRLGLRLQALLGEGASTYMHGAPAELEARCSDVLEALSLQNDADQTLQQLTADMYGEPWLCACCNLAGEDLTNSPMRPLSSYAKWQRIKAVRKSTGIKSTPAQLRVRPVAVDAPDVTTSEQESLGSVQPAHVRAARQLLVPLSCSSIIGLGQAKMQP